MCQANFSTWLCLVKGQSSSPAAWWIFVPCASERLPSWNFTKCISFLIILFKGIRYVCNYYHKARLCWALGSLHFCNWLFLSTIRSHEVLMAKDQCAKWFHYIQKPLPLAKKSHGLGKEPQQTNTYTLTHIYTYSSAVMYDHISEQQKMDYSYHTYRGWGSWCTLYLEHSQQYDIYTWGNLFSR